MGHLVPQKAGSVAFCVEKNYTLRRITTTGRDLPSDFLETIVQFHKDCESNFIDDDEFDANALNNMDETSVYVDKPSNYTYAKKVNINQVYSGFKLPIHILVNRVTELPNFQPPENNRIY